MRMNRLQGKIIWVTGASRGIGLATAWAVAQAGGRVALSARKQESLVDAALAINLEYPETAQAFPCHVGRAMEIDETLSRIEDEMGRPDVLINNAGTSPYFGSFLDAPEALWDKTFEVNLKGPFMATRAVARRWLDTGGSGSIINIASIQGALAAPLQGVYAMTKAALISMTQTMAHELGPAGIRVNAIAPGLVETRLASALTDNPEFSKMYTERAALRRYGQPNEIAGAAVFLASEAASYLTGQVIAIDGGYTAI